MLYKKNTKKCIVLRWARPMTASLTLSSPCGDSRCPHCAELKHQKLRKSRKHYLHWNIWLQLYFQAMILHFWVTIMALGWNPFGRVWKEQFSWQNCHFWWTNTFRNLGEILLVDNGKAAPIWPFHSPPLAYFTIFIVTNTLCNLWGKHLR